MLSTTHSEAIAMSDLTKQMLHQSMLEKQLGHKAVRHILTDNKAQLHLAWGSCPRRSAHQEWRARHIQAVVAAGVLKAAHVSTKVNPADVGSKMMRSKSDFVRLRSIFLQVDGVDRLRPWY